MITFCSNFELSCEWIWMNIKDHFCLSRHLLPAIALYATQQNWKCLHIRNRQYTELHISDLWSRRSPGRKPPLGFDFETDSDHKTQKIKLYLVRALKRYLNAIWMLSECYLNAIWIRKIWYMVELWQRFQNLVHRFLKRTLDLYSFGRG